MEKKDIYVLLSTDTEGRTQFYGAFSSYEKALEAAVEEAEDVVYNMNAVLGDEERLGITFIDRDGVCLKSKDETAAVKVDFVDEKARRVHNSGNAYGYIEYLIISGQLDVLNGNEE